MIGRVLGIGLALMFGGVILLYIGKVYVFTATFVRKPTREPEYYRPVGELALRIGKLLLAAGALLVLVWAIIWAAVQVV